MKRVFHFALHLAPFALTAVCTAWILTQSPFAAPFVEKSSQQIAASLTRAMARDVDAAWLLPKLQDAILRQDLIQLDLLLGIAADHAIVLPAPMIDDIAVLNAATRGVLASTARCGACAIDITSCETLTLIATCAVPFEMSPAGDLNSVRRAGVDYVAGNDVDRLDLGLAVVGLGATGAVLATGGGSYSIKAGLSLFRMARRLGTLTTPLAARVSLLLGDAVRWDRMGDLAALRIAPKHMVDSAKVAELANLGGSLVRVAHNTSVAEAVSLMRHINTAEDAARLARISAAMGSKTRGAFEVLGKARVFRATVRLGDLAIGAAVALYAMAAQILVLIGQQFGNLCLRLVRRSIG